MGFVMPLLQAITDQGALAANWVLIIAVGVVGFLVVALATIVFNHFISALKQIRDDLKEIKDEIINLRLMDKEQEIRIKSLEKNKG